MIPVMPTISASSLSEPQGSSSLPGVALIKLWEIGHEAYMAKFVGEKYVVIFSYHGDISLDGKYVSTTGTSTWVYTIDGQLLGQLTSEGTYKVDSWEPFSAIKVWERGGFFSADGKRMIEDIRIYGTDASVVDTTSWTTITIDWGFTAGQGYFYATQLDYSGSTLVAGGIEDGIMYIYRYDPSLEKYKLTFSHQESGNYGRRIQMTLDGKYIIIGGADYPYIDIWRYTEVGYNRVVHYQLPDSGGVTALGISDPWNVGYVIIGTKNGWVIIAYFDTTSGDLNILYESKKAPDGSWIYNPFYTRWMPKVTEVFALCTRRSEYTPGYGIIYDLLTNETTVIHFADPGTPDWKAAAVSPGANYVFLGNALYMVIKRDVQSGHPRLRFWGSMVFRRSMQDLGSLLTLEAPERDWHLYFFGGRVSISRIYTESIPVTLTDDEDILHGKLGKLYNRGLISATRVVESSGTVDKLELESVDISEAGFTEEHTIAMSNLFNVKALYGWDGHGFGGATVSAATIVHIPFSAPMDAYSEIKLQQSICVVTVSPVFDWKKELLGVFGLEFLSGGISYATGKALVSKAAQIAVSKAASWGVAESGVEAAAVAGASTATKIVGRVLTIVGIALLVDAGVGIYTHYITYSSVRSFVMTMPIIEDPYGNLYSAIVLALPMEEIKDHASEYQQHVLSLAEKLGIKDVGIQFIVWGNNWDEYKNLIEAGSLPTVDLKSTIETTIAAKYGYSLSQLRIRGVKLAIETLVHGKTNLWDYISGGLKVPVVTLIAGASIRPKAVVAGGKTYSDPAIIANLLGNKITVNGKDYQLIAGLTEAYADFQIQLGNDKLLIDFGGRMGYFADITINISVVIKKDMQPLGDYGYMVKLHYDWESMLIKIEKIEFVDMPYPMLYAERTFIFKYGNFTHDITEAFELSQVINDTNSPSGKLYYYTTVKNTKYIDPANGGIMQPCKTYVFRYFYKPPPDVQLFLYLNGTEVTCTKARHATIVLNSTMEQDVQYTISFSVKRLDGLDEEVLLEESFSGVLHVPLNGAAYKTYIIDKYVDKAIQVMASEGRPAFVEITARIINASYDSIKSNNEKTVIYYPPGSLVSLYGKPATLHVYVYDAINGSAVAGATVKLYNANATIEQTTNSSGGAAFSITVGLWNINITKLGYLTFSTQLYVYGNMTFSVPIVPEGAQVPPDVAPPLNNTNPPIMWNGKSYWWLSVQVMWNDGMPFQGALVTITDTISGQILLQLHTDGVGFVHLLILNGTQVKVEVNATNPKDPTQTFYSSREFTILHHTWLVFKTPWNSKYYEPEVMLTSLDVVIHRGQGYFFGNVSHLVMLGVWTNTPQTITVLVTLVNADNNQTIASKLLTLNLTEGLTVNMTWFDVNASQGMYVRAYANIISYEADTNLSNNRLRSNVVFLKPMVDIQVFAVWRPVYQRQTWTILPEDVIEVDIGIVLPINTSKLPAKLHLRVEKYDLYKLKYSVERSIVENITVPQAGTFWRNITVTVPWTSTLTITINVTHPWEDFGYNNYMNITIPIDPDVKISIIKKPTLVMEGQIYKVIVNVTSNVRPGGGIGWLSIIDNTTDTLLKRIQVTLQPCATIEIEFKAPENPTVLGFIKVPTSTHTITVLFSGYDTYTDNNKQSVDVTVVSYQWLVIIVIIIIIIAVLAAIKAATHTIHNIITQRRRFVRRKRVYSSLKHTVWHHYSQKKQEHRFVRKKG